MDSTRRRVLLVTYEFPPTGGAGVQRIAKFAKFLPAHGWDPVVLSGTHSPDRPIDGTLAAEVEAVSVVRTPARRVTTAVARLLALPRAIVRRLRSGRATTRPAPAPASPPGTGEAARPGPTARIASFISVPDYAAFWIGRTVSTGVRIGREQGVEAVFATAPPYSALLAGRRIAAALDVPFVADLRDAWVGYPSAYYPTPLHRRAAERLERLVMHAAAAVTCVSAPMADEAVRFGARRTIELPNGFDPDDIAPWAPGPGPLRLVFVGRMYPAHSDPATLALAMSVAAGRSGAAAQAVLEIVGDEAPFAREAVERAGVADRVEFAGYRPHREAVERLAAADAGVILIKDGPGSRASYTGKIFEYLAVGVPILLVGPEDGVAADLVREAGAGEVACFSDVEAIADAIVRLAEAKRQGVRRPAPREDVVARFDRRRQAERLARVLDEVVADAAR